MQQRVEKTDTKRLKVIAGAGLPAAMVFGLYVPYVTNPNFHCLASTNDNSPLIYGYCSAQELVIKYFKSGTDYNTTINIGLMIIELVLLAVVIGSIIFYTKQKTRISTGQLCQLLLALFCSYFCITAATLVAAIASAPTVIKSLQLYSDSSSINK